LAPLTEGNSRDPGVDALAIPGFAYDARPERRAWTMALSLLDEVFAEKTI
jgi:hypothetical protein